MPAAHLKRHRTFGSDSSLADVPNLDRNVVHDHPAVELIEHVEADGLATVREDGGRRDGVNGQ
jgi:hypothetical protein